MRHVLLSLSVLLTLVLPLSEAFAAPLSSGELIQVCQQALANGYSGRKAQMCTWYVSPCDCDRPNDQDFPRVCIPKSVPSAKLAEDVVFLLKELPEYKDSDGARAAAKLLAVLYPCPN